MLDYRRLGKQRVECKQIYQALILPSAGWKNHPAVKMWKGYELSLLDYAIEIYNEWISRGYKDSLHGYFVTARAVAMEESEEKHYPLKPHWFGWTSFHSSHRAALLKKDFLHYSQFKWKEVPQISYIWPDGKVGSR